MAGDAFILLNGAGAFWHTVGPMNKTKIRPYNLISSTPCDIFFANYNPDVAVKLIENSICDALLEDYFDCEFRGLSLDSLPAILEAGIDVRPTNSIIYASFPDKALE
jgi:hypothetical protein